MCHWIFKIYFIIDNLLSGWRYYENYNYKHIFIYFSSIYVCVYVGLYTSGSQRLTLGVSCHLPLYIFEIGSHSVEPVVHQLARMSDQQGFSQLWITCINHYIHLYQWFLGPTVLHGCFCKYRTFPLLISPTHPSTFALFIYIFG